MWDKPEMEITFTLKANPCNQNISKGETFTQKFCVAGFQASLQLRT